MRVLHVIAEMGVGGAESLVAEMATLGTGYDWTSAVASAGGVRADELRAAGVRCYDVPLVSRSVGGLLAARRAVAAAATDFDAEVIVAHNISATIVARAARPRLPVLSVFHGVAAADYRAAAAVLSAAPTRAVAVADAIAGRLRDHGLRRVPLTVIRNAVATPELPGRERARATLGLDPDQPVALCLARLEPQKRHDVLLRAWAAQDPGAVLLIAGDGSLRGELETRATGLGDRVRFLGNRDDVPTLLAATDLTVLTSDWEGLPMAILESMAVGVPLVASDVDGLREVLGKGGGTLVEPGDHEAFATAIAHALSSERWREEQSAAALRRIREDYSPAAMMTRYDTEIRGMIRARGSLRCRK